MGEHVLCHIRDDRLDAFAGVQVLSLCIAFELVLLVVGPGHRPLVDGHDQRLAAGDPGVNRSDGDAGAAADLLQGEPLEALLLEHLHASLEDALQ